MALPVDPTPVQSGDASLRIGHVDTWALFNSKNLRSCRYMGGYMILTIGGMPTGTMAVL